MGKTKRYSKRRKLTALKKLQLNGGNYTETSRQTGIPRTTLGSWFHKSKLNGDQPSNSEASPEIDKSTLDAQLEELARQMVAVMPEKVEAATLQELARTLAIVLSTMKQERAGKEENPNVYEKLARLMDRYAPERAAERDLSPTDGE